MIAYLIRRLLYAVPIIMGVVLITFILFFIVNKPEHMARRTLGAKATNESVEKWIQVRGYDLPLFFNGAEQGARCVTSTLFYQKCARVLLFDLGRSDATDRDIASDIRQRMWPSLAIGVPTFVIGLLVYVSISLIVAFCRGTYLDKFSTIVCVLMMSISILFYIIGGQFVMAKWLHLFPISGFEWGENMLKFILLPVIIGLVGGVGRSVRYYRTVMLEETNRDYVRTARAKGLGEMTVLFRHVLKNAMIPILTNAVMVIPFLFMGNLIIESFFAIPGLGSMTITAIHGNDFAVIRSMTFVAAVLYIIGLLLTDISYTLVDPRISLGSSEKGSLYGQPSFMEVVKILLGIAALGGSAAGLYLAGSYLGSFRWRIPVVENGVLILFLGGLGVFLIWASRNEMWRIAWREARRNRLAMVSLVIVGVYVLIAVLDSVTWRDRLKVEGAPAGAKVALSEPRTALDRLCKPLTDKVEKTYSAPMAGTLFTEENLEEEVDGKIVRRRGRRPLNYPKQHIFGTDKTGRDVFVVTLKSVRTGLIVGGFTTLIAIPFAIFFGVLAGFFGGKIDDAVQYVYSTLSSIPWVLLVVCFMMIFEPGLPQLCVVMGITGWVGLCRVLRGETMKLREREYVQAALALGVSKFQVLARHIVPNLMHLVLISVVLRFSQLVLAEAVLSYIGVGVGPDTQSWGAMINMARSELGRDPAIWWNLAASFIAMLALVLPANLFADALRDALDPRLRIRGEDD